MFGFVNKLAGRRRLSLAAVCGGSREFHMSTNPSEQSTAQPQSGGPKTPRSETTTTSAGKIESTA
jgi:hypothetical protein